MLSMAAYYLVSGRMGKVAVIAVWLLALGPSGGGRGHTNHPAPWQGQTHTRMARTQAGS